MHSSLEPVRFGSRFFCLCGDTRKKIVAIQIALFSACVDTRKNSRDLNRDSNRAFLVCGNAPIITREFEEHCNTCSKRFFICKRTVEASRLLC